MSTSREIHDHQTWLGYLQPDGLVVSPAALVDSGLNYDRNARPLQEDLLDHLRDSQGWDEVDPPVLRDLPAFLTGFLQWPDEALVSGDAIPNELGIFLPEYQEVIRPTHAIRDLRAGEDLEMAAGGYLMLLTELPAGTNFDKPTASSDRGWETTPSKRFERLLRESGVGTGILSNGTHLRLVHAPPGENPGSLTFPVAAMAEVTGRPILGGFHLLLEDYRVFTAPEKETLAAILKKSRDFQAHVSTALAQQVLDGLYELLRGLQAAHARTGQRLLRRELDDSPQTIYEAMLNVLMRLVFLLFAEDRGLMPASSLYEQNYALRSLYDQLRSDRERYPDIMDQRYGSWARLLALFRLVFQGSRHRDMKIPARYGYLFDPDRFPFLEGRTGEAGIAEKEHGTKNSLPLIPDGTILFVLEKLLYLGGERVSYRTLDVEQIGSVYETMMGFQLEVATGPTIALKPKKKHGAPSNVNLTNFLAIPAKDRAKVFTDLTDRTFTGARLTALKDATTQEELLAVFDHASERSSLIAKNATPTLAHEGALLLQPSEARRKSGSHYTPRKLTEPIVRKALKPILANLTGDATGSSAEPDPVGSPAAATKVPFPSQILELKVCDPAVGSGAFLVEACRQLGDELVKAWAAHGGRPQIPDDEDEILLARRLVAQRCLYGVDRNPMAADLAKLSLWLATLAKDHPFTFLSHAIRSGDSLVGLSKKQILAFHWDTGHPSAQQMAFGQDIFERNLKSALAYRQEILQAGDYVLPEMKAAQLRLADEALEPIRQGGDLAILAFFSVDKKNARQEARERILERWQLANDGTGSPESLREGLKLKDEIRAAKEAEKPVIPFHWEIEFTEVFERANPGFDCFVGNPPFLGGSKLSQINGKEYLQWAAQRFAPAFGKSDLVAYFFRLAEMLLRQLGTFGLITTKSIRQGDTRRMGLAAIRRKGASIYHAQTRIQWPGEAAVVVAVVHVIKGSTPPPFLLDGRAVSTITSYLFHQGSDDDAAALSSNKPLVHSGTNINGKGFVLSPDEKSEILTGDANLGSYVRSYLGAEELNSVPNCTPIRFVTYLEGIEEEAEVRKLKPIYERLYSTVRLQRINSSEKRLREKWWIYSRPAASLYRAADGLRRIIASGRAGSFFRFVFQDPSTIFSDSLTLFTIESYAGITLLQCRVHESWALFFCSSLKDDPRYIPEDCFETFPFPLDWETNDALETIGQTYYDFRADLMIRNDEGLTKTYNRFHDPGETMPEILRLRELHAEMDRAVLDAYGWTKVPTACEFIPDFTEEDDDGNEIPKNIRYRWPDDVRDDVLARLLALNAERAAEEARAVLQAKAKVAKKKSTTKRKTTTPGESKEDGFKSGFARRLLAAEILRHTHDQPTMGRVKLQKLIHLCEYHAKIHDLDSEYKREAAGPFDNKMLRGIETGLEKLRWFKAVKSSERTHYEPLEKANQHVKFLDRWEDHLPAVHQIIDLFRTAKTQQCEIVSTLYAAWNDLIIERVVPNDIQIIEQASTSKYWHKSKEEISKDRWIAALGWMREHKIVPQGFGAATERRKDEVGEVSRNTTKVPKVKSTPSSLPSDIPHLPLKTQDVVVPFPVPKKTPAPILVPTGNRTSQEDSLPYFLLLIPILLKKAGGTITWEDLQRTVIALLEPDQIESRLGDAQSEAVQNWRRNPPKISQVTAFGTALEDLVVSRKVIRVVKSPAGYEFRSADGLADFEEAWIEFDADVALAAASSVSLENSKVEANVFVHIPVERWSETG